MQKYNFTILILSICLSGCIGQTKSDIDKAKELVKEAEAYVKSDEAINEQRRLNLENHLTEELKTKIEAKGSADLKNSCDLVIKISTKLIQTLDSSILMVAEKQGRDSKGDLKNKMDPTHVNQIFIQDEQAKLIKSEILNSIETYMKIVSKHDLKIDRLDLALQLNLFMEEKGKSWEEYTFKNMPPGPLMPIIKKYRNDAVLVKIQILEELAK